MQRVYATQISKCIITIHIHLCSPCSKWYIKVKCLMKTYSQTFLLIWLAQRLITTAYWDKDEIEHRCYVKVKVKMVMIICSLCLCDFSTFFCTSSLLNAEKWFFSSSLFSSPLLFSFYDDLPVVIFIFFSWRAHFLVRNEVIECTLCGDIQTKK